MRQLDGLCEPSVADAARYGGSEIAGSGRRVYLCGMMNSRDNRWPLLCAALLLSGAAGLVYELVWFQLLHLTIGAGSQSIGVLLACYMGGLFLGSLVCGRLVPVRLNSVRMYALMELGIGLLALLLPHALMFVRATYFTLAASPGQALVFGSLLCVVLLVPPTLLMGATFPVLARCFDESRRGYVLGWLYAANLIGAVAGVLAGVLLLLPMWGLLGANLFAVGMNVAAALIAVAVSGGLGRAGAKEEGVASGAVLAAPAGGSDLSVMLAYALSGLAAMSFQVVAWRLYSVLLGTTTYAFGLLLAVFLAGLGLGSAIGGQLVRRGYDPRRAMIDVQLGTAALIGVISLVVPLVAGWRYLLPWLVLGGGFAGTAASDLIRVVVVVFPAAIGWGMAFPLSVGCLGQEGGDAARSIGRLYAFNTLGAVAGSLLTSFVLIPRFGSSTAGAHLVWLPMAAAAILLLGRGTPRWVGLVVGLGVVVAVFTSAPLRLCSVVKGFEELFTSSWYVLGLALVPAFIGLELFLIRRVPRRLALGGALTGVLVAAYVPVPKQLYRQGHSYSGEGLLGSRDEEIVFFSEGAMAPVVVERMGENALMLKVNGLACAGSEPMALQHLRLLGHLPALLSASPEDVVLVGLGAGASAGSAALHERVRRVTVAEIEPDIVRAAACFADVNHGVTKHPKVRIVFQDGRHLLATTRERFGVISSDPIAPYWMGSAALYTTEYYELCRSRLVEGGIFMQWFGLFGIDEEGIRSLLAAFAEVFPDGLIWLSQEEVLLMASTGPIRIDVERLREDWDRSPAVAESLAGVGIANVEELLALYVCPVASLQTYIAGSTPNRDGNLLSQYKGWKAFHQAETTSSSLMSRLLAHRDSGDAVFVVPDAERQAFREAIEAARKAGKPASVATQPHEIF